MKSFWFAALLSLLSLSASAAPHCVVLLHGLARSAGSMSELEHKLAQAEFVAVNVNYASRKFSIEQLAEKAIKPALKQCPPSSDISFVTHSMGGILVRQYLSEHKLEKLKRIVMLGPPNQGSEIVDKLGQFPGFHFINGDAGLQLGTGALSVPNKLGAANYDIGIIAGTRSINLILSLIIPGSDDGKVSVERTKLEGMKDHLQMPVTHVFMMKNNKVIRQVLHYLRNGAFKRAGLQREG